MITYKGNQYKSIADAARAHDLSPTTIRTRLNRGLSLFEALSIPIRKTGTRKRRLKYYSDFPRETANQNSKRGWLG